MDSLCNLTRHWHRKSNMGEKMFLAKVNWKSFDILENWHSHRLKQKHFLGGFIAFNMLCLRDGLPKWTVNLIHPLNFPFHLTEWKNALCNINYSNSKFRTAHVMKTTEQYIYKVAKVLLWRDLINYSLIAPKKKNRISLQVRTFQEMKTTRTFCKYVKFQSRQLITLQMTQISWNIHEFRSFEEIHFINFRSKANVTSFSVCTVHIHFHMRSALVKVADVRFDI